MNPMMRKPANAKQKPKAKASDGGGSPQPEVREEGGSAAVSGEGVQPSGPEGEPEVKKEVTDEPIVAVGEADAEETGAEAEPQDEAGDGAVTESESTEG